MKYRTEIDGLRALAVIPVILFHAGFELFSGGFVGVDVFFVISGYLITTILIEDIEHNRFSFLSFYERRARRILPALFFVMLLCIPFAWMWMLPSQMKDFSQSLVAVSLFSSNILFWLESGYFEAAAEAKPLLHTWSLSIEEQYYVFFPIFLFLAWRLGKNTVFWMIVVFAAISLVLSEWSWRNYPAANFYLAPTRVWELFAGSIAAFIVQKRDVQANNVLSLLGIAAILFAIFAFDESTPFFSVYALLPVIGTVFLILYADENTLATKFLSTKAFVSVGLISYSAYLWHQPLFAFSRIKLHEESSMELKLLLSVLSLLLAAFSWRFIEKPFRGADALIRSRGKLLTSSVIGLLAFVLIGNLFDNLDFRLTQDQKDLIAYENYPKELLYKDGECFLRDNQTYKEFDESCVSSTRSGFFIWGDSFAAALVSGLTEVEGSVSQRTASACPPLLNLGVMSPYRPNCEAINSHNLEFLKKYPNFDVILHANWGLYVNDYEKNLENTVIELKKIGVNDIVIVGGFPLYLPSLPVALFKEGVMLNAPYVGRYDQRSVRAIDEKLRIIALSQNVSFASALDAFCEQDKCVTVVGQNGSYVPTAWDYGHLTHEGSIYLSEKLFGSEL